jgi:GNAT superfamily N-acetyltransferase
MKIRSLGWSTDVSLRRLEGAQVEQQEGHLVIRTNANPTYRWGNFLLFPAPPAAGDAERWLAQFQLAFPRADYVAIGVDSPSGDLGDTGDLITIGLSIDVDTVLTAEALRAPRRESPGAELRRVESDEDWRKAMCLRILTAEDGETPAYRVFVEREMQAIRRVCERGQGAWFAAFIGGEACSSLGVFAPSPGLARFQSVDTHPAHRRQGLASSLLYRASEWARGELRAKTLVIAADPNYFAIDIYRSLGFSAHDHKIYLSRV